MSAGPLPSALVELVRDLGLDPAGAALTRRPGSTGHLVLPSVDRPQLLVPVERAGAVVVAERRTRSGPDRWRKRLVAGALRSGVLRQAPVCRLQLPAEGLSDLLRVVSPSGSGDDADADAAQPTSVACLAGPPRANRKPVLRLFDPSGDTSGYVKLAVSDLTGELIERETTALRAVAALGLTTLRAPAALGAGTWTGRPFLTISPLAGGQAHRQPTSLPVAATTELASRHSRTDLPLRATRLLRAATETAASTDQAVLEGRRAQLVAAVGDLRLPLGAAHGDWTPWNLAWTGPDLLDAWDWERFAVDVPQGLDAIHFEATRVRSDNPGRTEAEFLARLPAALRDCGIDPALCPTLLSLYLLDVGNRLAADLARSPAARGQARLAWVQRLLTTTVAGLELDREVSR